MSVRPWVVLLGVAVLAGPGRAELIGVEFTRREDFAGGAAFGDTGPYEKLVGVARFAVDPAAERNKVFSDLGLAPRNKDGKVEFRADVFLLVPKDRTKGNGALLFDVNNRGNKLALTMFNTAAGSNDPTTADHAGNGFLFRRGYTVAWCGWTCEPLPGNGRMLLEAPVATANDKPIRGAVRFETSVNVPAESAPLSWRDNLGSPTPLPDAESKGRLTWRQTNRQVPQTIPNEQWSLERLPIPKSDGGVPGSQGQVRLHVKGGLRPGHLYELTCECEGPRVQGVGFFAVRDFVSFLRYSADASNPLRRDGKATAMRAHGFGVSQSGRFLREFLFLGCNADESGRPVFDAVMPHVAGAGRMREATEWFGQPTRSNGAHEEHEYRCDTSPFSYDDTQSLLGRLQSRDPKCVPLVMHTQSAAEYWHRSGSLVHARYNNENRPEDIRPTERVRIYAFGGTQHGAGSGQPAATPGHGENLPNPADYRPLLRALLDGLDGWAKTGTAPPPSLHPRIADNTLTMGSVIQFPGLPGVRHPSYPNQPRGIPGQTRPDFTFVPTTDADGNDRGCLLIPDVAVPLATYTGWNLRRREAGAEGELLSLTGSYIPFPKTKADREAAGDPRQSIAERYGSFEEYRKRYAAECERLVKAGYLLQEDADRLIASRDAVRGRFPAEDGK